MGAVLSLLDGPRGCDPAFLCGQVERFLGCIVYWMLLLGCALVTGLSIWFLIVPLRLGFGGTLLCSGWKRLGLLVLSNLAGPIQHFREGYFECLGR